MMNQSSLIYFGTVIRSFGFMCGIGLLSQCSAPISVQMEKPVVPAGTPDVAPNTDALFASLRSDYQRITRGDDSAIPAYNYKVARLIEHLEKTGEDPWSKPMTLSADIRLKGVSPSGTSPINDKLYPADTLSFHGKYSKEHAQVSGIGAPLALLTSFAGSSREKSSSNLPLRNLTAIVRFEGKNAQLELLDPYQVETISLAGKSRTLAADYGAATMLGLSKSRIDKLGLARLLHPSRYDDTAHLNFLQPYDPKRIPVLMVHGLQDTPASFAPMYYKLLQDPNIRENYQFWVFSYPSGYPYPYSASLLRRELDEVKRNYPGYKNMVLIGHSMGSLISRLMVTDVGDKLWVKAFKKPPSETRMAGYSRGVLMKSLVFSDRKDIDRVLFYSGPHRGSILASNWIGAAISRLVQVPSLMADVRNAALSVASVDIAGLEMSSAPNSIDTLSPSNPFVKEINKYPITPRIPYHTIVGDRGKGDTPDSTDGVVAYWSSHLDGPASEKVVPSDHGSHQDPQGIEEARRILYLHLNK
jgi:pimeloyl-ACP methyl ester carboxylesterase